MNSMLRGPLIKSAALLAVISLLVYFTAVSEEGSLWNSLGILFAGVFGVVQFALGLLVSLFFCLAVLTGIFLGCVAMVSRENSARMWDQLRQVISDNLLSLRSILIREPSPRSSGAPPAQEPEPRAELMERLDNSLVTLRQGQEATTERLEQLAGQVETLKRQEVLSVISDRQEKQGKLLDGLAEGLEQLKGQVGVLEGDVSRRIVALQDKVDSPEDQSLRERIAELEQGIMSLGETVTALQVDLTSGVPAEPQERSGEVTPGEQRLFVHLKGKAAREKVSALVSETLGTGMSYAQVMDLLLERTGGETAKTLAAHPSLVKEYIRFRRQAG